MVAPRRQGKVEDFVVAKKAEFVHGAIDAVFGFLQRGIERIVVADDPATVLDFAGRLNQVPRDARIGVIAVNVDEVERLAGQSAQAGGGVALVELDAALFDREAEVVMIEEREIEVEDVQYPGLEDGKDVLGEPAGLGADFGADAALGHERKDLVAVGEETAVAQMDFRQLGCDDVGEIFDGVGVELIQGGARGIVRSGGRRRHFYGWGKANHVLGALALVCTQLGGLRYN